MKYIKEDARMDKKRLDCSINVDLYEKFNMALGLNKESMEDVVEHLISNYISESFLNAAKNLPCNKSKPTTPALREDSNFAKANRKIPGWSRKGNQNNHKILKAFLQIEEEQGEVLYDELVKRCSNAKDYPDTFVSDFTGNFAQMKTDASNSHGKVFILEGDKVEIWDEILSTVRQYRDDFLNSKSGKGDTMKITNDMTEKAYEIVKMVYQDIIGRTEGKYKIADETGMNASSAGDYITDFLAMMDGKRYTRTMNTYATKYFLLSISADFGEEQFEKALNATREHIKYYNGLNNGTLHSIQNVIDELGEVKSH